jgi:hypothetical protein
MRESRRFSKEFQADEWRPVVVSSWVGYNYCVAAFLLSIAGIHVSLISVLSKAIYRTRTITSLGEKTEKKSKNMYIINRSHQQR